MDNYNQKVESSLFEIEPSHRLMRDETIQALGFTLDSNQAKMIYAMTDACFSMGLERGTTLIELIENGSLSKEMFLKAFHEHNEKLEKEIKELEKYE